MAIAQEQYCFLPRDGLVVDRLMEYSPKPLVVRTILIDNHGSGYLGMAGCFSVQGKKWSKRTHFQPTLSWFQMFLEVTNCTSLFYNLHSLRISSYSLENHSCTLQQAFEKMYRDRILPHFF